MASGSFAQWRASRGRHEPRLLHVVEADGMGAGESGGLESLAHCVCSGQTVLASPTGMTTIWCSSS